MTLALTEPGTHHDGVSRSGFYPPTVAPSQKPLSLPGYVWRMLRNPLETWPAAVYEEKIAVFKVGARVAAWVMDPYLLKQVLLEKAADFPKGFLERRALGPALGEGILIAEGAHWRWQRQAVAPLFRHGALLQYVPVMSRAAEAVLREWDAVSGGQVRQVDLDMTRATYEVISNTVLAGDDPSRAVRIEHANQRYFRWVPWEIALSALRVPAWVPHPGKFGMYRAARDMRNAVGELIAERRAHPAQDEDLFTRLANARHPDTGERMPDELLIDNLLTFLEAGHETTAKALTWALYLAAAVPEWQQRVRDEALAVAGANQIGAGHVDKLVVTQQFLKEAMRLYPPASVIVRVAARDVELGGHKLPEGSFVAVPIYAIHRHRKLWKDPERFDPSRFEAEREREISRYQYMPFGAGARICIGMSFAMIEAAAIFATLLRNHEVALSDASPPVPVSRITLGPAGGLTLHVKRIGA